jgi:NADH:ubiquinone oxidoreductase subunit E
VAGSEAVIAEIEKVIGVTIGETSKDGKYSFDWMECQGQCQSAPTILVNDEIYTDMTPEKVRKLLEGGLKAC